MRRDSRKRPSLKRGDLITVIVAGDFGKPRPALIVQADYFADLATVTVCLISSEWNDAPRMRIPILPSPTTGLKAPSQIMIDKLFTVWREKIGGRLGHADEPTMLAVNRALAVFIGLA